MHATLVKIVIIINFVISAMDGPFYRGLGGVPVYPYYRRIPKTDCLYPPLCHLLFFNDALSSLPCIRNEVQCKHGTCPMIFVCNGSGNWYLPNGICWIFENNLLFWRICVNLSDFRCSAHINQYHTTFIPWGCDTFWDDRGRGPMIIHKGEDQNQTVCFLLLLASSEALYAMIVYYIF